MVIIGSFYFSIIISQSMENFPSNITVGPAENPGGCLSVQIVEH